MCARSSTEAHVLRQSFDMLLAALGNDREAVGDAIYGLKIHALTAVKADYRPRMAWNGYIYIYIIDI